MKTKSRVQAFSLVELVIVVVIIGVIAAIAVPRISRGAKGAGESALRGSLASLRNSIDMYAAEHKGDWPGADADADTLLDQLIKKTDASGIVGTTAGTHIYGPYLRSGFPPVPVGPNVGATGVIMSNVADLTTVIDEATDKTMGWIYNYETGDIIVNTDDKDEKDNGYETY
ncbi:MAG: prepilin-type N-terminal cleavage/methylation domain-containing protein [Phycisphaerae bacterium]